MSDIVPAVPASLAARDLRRAVRGVTNDAAVRVTRVQAQTFVAHAALSATGLMATLEEEVIKRSPLAEPRAKAIADIHAGVVAAEILRPW